MKRSNLSITVAVAAVLAASTNTSAASTSRHAPKMVLGIVVEGLTEADIYLAGEDGAFAQLSRGVVIPDVDFRHAKGVAAHAMLVTGTTPSYNGISSSRRYDREGSTSIVNDPSYIGNFTRETYSPAAIKTSTITDELKIASGGKSQVYSIAALPEQAIVGAGHAGGSGLWINPYDGRWSTSTYYKDVPRAVTTINYKRPLQSRIDTMSWTGPKANRGVPLYRYFFPSRQKDSFEKFRLTPRANDEITDLACEVIASFPAPDGSVSLPHMLSVVYSVDEYPYGTAASTVAEEKADAYRRLDGQISRLLNAVNATVGLDNAIVYLAGIPGEGLSRAADDRWGIPTGEFSPRKARALLNMYLMALHGNGEWVSAMDHAGVRLNSELAKARDVDLKALRAEAAEFMLRMSGVCEALTAEQVLSSSMRDFVEPQTMPDVIFTVNPGWVLTETDDPSTEGLSLRAVSSSAPLFILYPPLGHKTVETTVDATAIAPTLSRIIRIRAPNASASSPLIF